MIRPSPMWVPPVAVAPGCEGSHRTCAWFCSEQIGQLQRGCWEHHAGSLDVTVDPAHCGFDFLLREVGKMFWGCPDRLGGLIELHSGMKSEQDLLASSDLPAQPCARDHIQGRVIADQPDRSAGSAGDRETGKLIRQVVELDVRPPRHVVEVQAGLQEQPLALAVPGEESVVGHAQASAFDLQHKRFGQARIEVEKRAVEILKTQFQLVFG